MTELLGLASGWLTEAALVAAIVFLRVGAAAFALPGFGEGMIPVRVRLLLALLLAAAIAPAAADAVLPAIAGAAGEAGPAEPADLAALIAAESAVGLAIGLAARLFIHALQIAGTAISQAASLSQLMGAPGGEAMTGVSQCLSLGGMALASAAGLHADIARLMATSYEVFPPGTWPEAMPVLTWMGGLLSRTFALAIALTAPFLAASLLYNLALGAISRAMPQLMVTFVGAPALTLGALALMAASLPIGLAVWHDALSRFVGQPFGSSP
jgi:flagellar biosynthetic protein FliR